MKNALSSLKGWQAIPAVIIGLYLVLGIFGPTLAPFDPEKQELRQRLCPPLAIDALNTSDSPSEWASHCRATNILGTDDMGRDIFSRLLYGARTSLAVVLPGVAIGTMVGLVIGVLVNTWRRKTQLVAYAISGLTIVPFAVLIFGPCLLLFASIFAVNQDVGVSAWTAVMTVSIFSALLTIALIAVAYQYDDTCRSSRFSEVDADYTSNGFPQLLRRQISTLAHWIGLAAPASAALAFVFLHTRPVVLRPAIEWKSAWEYQFEHVGILSPFLPTVLFPIAFVTFGLFWFLRHIRHRLTVTSKPTLGSAQSVAHSAEGYSTEEETDRFASASSESDGNDALIASGSSVKIRGWMMVVIAAVVVAAVVPFVVRQAVPTVRILAQYSDGSYESEWMQPRQERDEVWDCAWESMSRDLESEPDAPENSEIEAIQHCRDLYFKHRNAPSHRYTLHYFSGILARTLTLALVASIVSAVLWSVASASTRAVRMMLEVLVVLVAIIGLTITFGFLGWNLVVIRWLGPLDPHFHSEYNAVRIAIDMVGEFAVALDISYLTIAMTKPILRFAKTDAVMDVLSRWTAFFVPCVLFISGFLILFSYPFPSKRMYDDFVWSAIVDPSSPLSIILAEDWVWANLSIALLENWLWTYWFALIGYAAIVFGLFAVAIWGFSRLARRDTDDVGPTFPLNPDNPSPDADPI